MPVTAITLASSNAAGIEGNAASLAPSISADGRYVAFSSSASDLVPGDTNGVEDVFVKDMQTGAIRLVSGDAAGNQGNARSHDASISADGRHVAFRSLASNLIPGDTNGYPDIFVKDLQTGAITLASANVDGEQGDYFSYDPSISADGRLVAFSSAAFNLPGNRDDAPDIFVKDVQTGEITVASMNALSSFDPSISADGRYVAYTSFLTGEFNLDDAEDLFVRDRQADEIILVAENADSGTDGLIQSLHPSLSADGRYVAFHASSSDLVAGDANGTYDVFVKDLQSGAIRLVSTNAAGEQGNAQSLDPSISADGRYVAFRSLASNLVPGDTNGAYDVFVKDLETGEVRRLSTGAGGTQANGSSLDVSLSADGGSAAFSSLASNLVAGDDNGAADVFAAPSASAEPNGPPAASDDSFTTTEDTALTIAAPGILGNDSDADGDALTAALVTGPQHGTLAFAPNGSFTYTPALDFFGSDSFTYKTSDGAADSNVATVNLTIAPQNDAPVAVNDAYTLDEDTTLRVPVPGLLGNDSDADGEP